MEAIFGLFATKKIFMHDKTWNKNAKTQRDSEIYSKTLF